MNPESNFSTTSQTLEERIVDVKTKAISTFDTYEQKVRQSPEKAILIAVAAGYCLQVLPIRVLIGAPVRMALFLAKPAILALGAAKLCEIVQSQKRQ